MNSEVYALALNVLRRCWTHHTIILTVSVILLVRYFVRRWVFIRSLSWIPGPTAIPILGNSLSLTGGQVEFFRLLLNSTRQYGQIFKLWVGMRPFLFISGARYAQPILGSKLHTEKSYEYQFLYSWLGSGLVTSNGSKWYHRRKLLTPTFHYSILEEFIEPIVEQSLILIQCLSKMIDQPAFNIMDFTKLCALDVICVTAMGKCINAQLNEDHEYVKAIEGLNRIVQRRFITPWLKPDFIFNLTNYGRKQREYVKTVNEFVDLVIQEKKKNFNLDQVLQTNGKKRKNIAFLELILAAAEDGKALTDDEIREEVNTFMFAGHDTTSVTIGWCLYVLGKHPQVQEKILEEYNNTVESTIPKYEEIQKLQYLDCVIKEVMRLYPVVPLIARNIKFDVPISEKQVLPPGVTALIFTPSLHRDPEYFSSPNEFVPERFLNGSKGPDNAFAYIPFSAGPRNCIGSKFAMIELKIVLHTILKHYKVKSVESEQELNLYSEIVLMNRGGIQIEIQKRT